MIGTSESSESLPDAAAPSRGVAAASSKSASSSAISISGCIIAASTASTASVRDALLTAGVTAWYQLQATGLLT